MRASDVKYIIVHCAATKPSMDIGFEDIDRWHKDRGWSGCGYHIIIRRNGVLEYSRGLKPGGTVFRQGAHVQGFNDISIGVCLVGGMTQNGSDPEINFTDEQMASLRDLLDDLTATTFKGAQIRGHYQFDKHKSCPNFDAEYWYDTEELRPTFT